MFKRFCAITLLAAFALVIGSFLPAVERQKSRRWERAIEVFEAADKKSPPVPGAVLFVGSSSIRFWKTLQADFPQYRVINRGFGGSHIADCTAFADRIVIPYRPSVMILHAGSNDLDAGESPEQVFADYKAFVAKVRDALPDTPMAFVAINPTPRRWAQAAKQQETNRLIRDYIAGKQGLAFIDIWDALLGPDGRPRDDLHVRDHLHPNAAGYKIPAARIITAWLDSLKLPKSSPPGKQGRLTTTSSPTGSSGSH